MILYGSFSSETSASGGRVFGSAECSASEFRTTNHEELERLVGNNFNPNTAASTKNWLHPQGID